MHINILHPFHKIFTIRIDDKNYNKIYSKTDIPIEWQMILINEGSFTKNLHCLTNKKTSIIMQQKYNHNFYKTTTRNIRCVWLENSIYTKLTFARSLWMFTYKDSIYKQLNINQPIGQLLIESKIDIYKQIQEIYFGYCQYLEQSFDIAEPIWGRRYILYYNYKAYAIIQEFFSPNIINFFHIL
uniref:Chorismate lyase n=1 Tax=Sphondylothamnion multifidum TaxID=193186 RepID=A0A4D6X226_9FLOR|nr:hypothetical protein [Sphondylothamnion multifidum]